MGILDQLLGNASERNLEKLQDEFGPLLAPGETLVKAYAVIRDLIVFTDRRLILSNKQGITGSKVEYLNIPYRSIRWFTLKLPDISIWNRKWPAIPARSNRSPPFGRACRQERLALLEQLPAVKTIVGGQYACPNCRVAGDGISRPVIAGQTGL